MAITASRSTLGMDREVNREAAISRGRASLMRKGLRQAKKEKNYEKALGFASALEGEGKGYGMTGSAADTASVAQGRVASREALVNQMRSQTPALTGQTREGNIAAAKAAGTFDATRAKFNEANKGKKVMDDTGNIADAPTTTPPAASPGTPPTTTPAVDVKPEIKVVMPGEKGSEAPMGRTPFDRRITNVPANEKKAMANAMEEDARAKSRDLLANAIAEGRVGARAKGGPVKAGKPYLVGEEGPELVVPDEDGEVIPNKDLKRKKTRKMLKAAMSKK
jgi:hypothetical protein